MTVRARHLVIPSFLGVIVGMPAFADNVVGDASNDIAHRDDNKPAEDDLYSPPPKPLEASSSDVLGSCVWKKNTSTTVDLVSAPCGSNQRVISGGCTSSASGRKIEWMRAYENSDALNPPDDGEYWYQTTNGAGWTCQFTSSGTTNTALALCCGT